LGEWLAPRSLDEALALRTEHRDDATVVAGGTFVAVLLNQGFAQPAAFLSLRDVDELGRIDVEAGDLVLGAMTTHREVERSATVLAGWPGVAEVFSVVATPRIRNQATVGGVVADADYASDPPAMLTALDARAVLRRPDAAREAPLAELIVGPYQTTIGEDELLTEIRVPAGTERAVYRKFRSRSREDLPCVGVAAAVHRGALRVVVGAACGSPLHLPEACALRKRADVARAYAEGIDPVSDVRGSAEYRRRVVEVEVRRALEDMGWGS
jgi:carbon-monoxide dehydrogenase medium subunit